MQAVAKTTRAQAVNVLSLNDLMILNAFKADVHMQRFTTLTSIPWSAGCMSDLMLPRKSPMANQCLQQSQPVDYFDLYFVLRLPFALKNLRKKQNYKNLATLLAYCSYCAQKHPCCGSLRIAIRKQHNKQQNRKEREKQKVVVLTVRQTEQVRAKRTYTHVFHTRDSETRNVNHLSCTVKPRVCDSQSSQ